MLGKAMLEFFTERLAKLWTIFIESLQGFAMPLAILVGIATAAGIAVRFAPKEDQLALQEKLRFKGTGFSRVLMVVGLLAVLSTIYRMGVESVQYYRAYATKERFDSKEVVSGSSVNQNLPAARIQYSIKRRRVETFYANQTQSYKSAAGVDWKRLLNDNGRKPQEITSVIQQGQNTTQVIYENEETVEAPVDMSDIDVTTKLSSVRDANPLANAYALNYKGSFSWKNPKSEPVVTTLGFQLPSHGGTITSVKASVDGKPVEVTAENGILRLSTELAASKPVNFTVEYETKGRGVFRHYLFEDQRIIPNFKMTLNSESNVRFERGSLTPKEEKAGVYSWNMANTVTQQHISVAIPYARGTNEIWWKLSLMAPVALCLFGAGLALLDRLRNLGKVVAAVGMTFACYALPLAFPMMDSSPYILGLVSIGGSVLGSHLILGKNGMVAGILGGVVLASTLAGPYTALVILVAIAGVSVFAAKSFSERKRPAA